MAAPKKKTLSPPHPITIGLAAGGSAADDARKKLLDELRAAGGRIDRVAESLGIHRITVIRMVQRAKLGDIAAEIRGESGVPGPKTSQQGQKQKKKVPHVRVEDEPAPEPPAGEEPEPSA